MPNPYSMNTQCVDTFFICRTVYGPSKRMAFVTLIECSLINWVDASRTLAHSKGSDLLDWIELTFSYINSHDRSCDLSAGLLPHF